MPAGTAALRDFPRNLVQHLNALADQRPADTALIVVSRAGEQRFDYRRLAERVRSLAAVLQSRIPSGERALLLLDNDEHYVVAFLACLHADLIAVPVFPPESTRAQHLARLAAIADDCKAAAVLTSTPIRDLVGEHASIFGRADIIDVDAVGEDWASQWRPHEPHDSDIAFLQYTSGSTSTPKGVMVSHGNLMANERTIEELMSIRADDVFVSWLPLYHDMGLIGGLLQPLHRGIPVVLMSPGFFLERPIRWLEAISRHRGTISGGPDFAYRMCLDRVKDAGLASLDLSSWRVAFSGAEPVRHDTLVSFIDRFAPAGFSASSVYPCYGLAEATLLVTGGRRGAGLVARSFTAGSVAQGRPLPADGTDVVTLVGCGASSSDHRVDIVDAQTSVPVPAGHVGEIWASGQSVARGYWHRREESEGTFVDAAGRRWLRTGDLGFIHDGELFITGRIKDVIIVRGHNLYPQDIERAIEAEVEAVRAGRVAAFAVQGPDGEGIGVAAEVSRSLQKLVPAQALVASLGALVSEQFGQPLSVVVLLNPGGLPRTSSGKLQRQAARLGWMQRCLDAYAIHEHGHFVVGGDSAPARDAAPQDELTQAVAEVWRAACRDVGAQPLAGDAHFFLLGGHSIAAAQAAAQIAEHWQVDFPVRLLFEHPRLDACVAALRQRLAVGSREVATIPALPEASRRGPLALSHAQRRQWFLWRLDPAGTAYHVAARLRLQGPLDEAAMRRAVVALVARHESLRTLFMPDADGNPVQHIQPHDASLGEAPWAASDVADEAAADAAAAAANAEPFDLRCGPLLRVRLLRLAPQTHQLVLVLHHIVADGVSMAVLIAELARLYRGDALAGLPLQYADYAAWHADWLAAGAGTRQLAYWRQQLGDMHPVLALPTDHPRQPVAQYRAAQFTCEVPPALAAALQRRAAGQGTTRFTALLAAFQALLHRCTGLADIRVGVPVANRHHAGTQGLVGFFVNTLVLRNPLEGRSPLERVLADAAAAMRAAQAHPDLPFEQLVEALQPPRSAAHPPLFQVLFNHLHEDLGGFAQVTGLSARLDTPPPAAAQFELALDVREPADGPLRLQFTYARELFEPHTIERLAQHYLAMLRALADAPAQAVGDVPLLGADEQARLQTWSVNDDRPGPLEPVHRLIERQVRRTPHAPALLFEQTCLSYAELNARANRLAHHLIALGVRPDHRVAIAAERSVEMVVGLLAVLKAGAAYVPLDPGLPAERLAGMLADSAPSLLLAPSHLPPGLGSVPVLDLDTLDVSGHSALDPEVALHPDHLAYVIYTSGSTGRPKGCANHHGALANRLAWMQQAYPLGPADTVLQKTPFSFDVSVWEFFWPLMVGARLAVARPGDHRDPARLVALIQQHRVSTLHFVPSMLQAFVDHPGVEACIGLRHIVCSGEALPAEWQQQVFERLPGVQLHNLYGPTEAAIDVTHWTCRPDGGASVPIGRPIAHTQARVLDAGFAPVPQGVAGELCLGGIGLARGYLGRPGLTAERFVADPFIPGARLYRTGDLVRWRQDGQLEYLGRLDHQVKLRGLRIELGEIEAQLLAVAGVREAVVVARAERLVAYLCADRPLAVDGVRAELARHLPDYMVPATVVQLERLPLNANGKVDRKALPEPPAPAVAEPPQGGWQQRLAAIWREVLGVGQVGPHDNFFDLGGHSLLLIRAHRLIEERLGAPVPLMALFQYPTLRGLAAFIAGHQAPMAGGPSAMARGGDIAIVGLAGRFPGAPDVETFWARLRDGVESVTRFSDEVLRARGVPQRLLDDPGYVKAGVVLDGIGEFDAEFFGYTPREAERLDPQHRLLLECAWEALEHAGHSARSPARRVGVFAGDGANLYLLKHLLPAAGLDADQGIADLLGLLSGNASGSLATRLAYKLNLQGPAVSVQTACSTSLVAVHQACRALQSGDCEMALAGGVWLNLLQDGGYRFQAGAILSPDGHCRAFDAEAGGTVIGSGAGIVVLRRLADALADGDTVHAVIKGSAANNDGADKLGFTAPSINGQADVIRAALHAAGVDAGSIGYVEAHGTGTTLGDPVEVAALAQAFGRVSGRCAIGSVKTNIGHLDAAAGVAGLIKTVMALKHQTLPPSLHFSRPNPRIDFAASPFYVNTEAHAWPRAGTPRRAGVSSFGIGGTNVHVVLEEAPAADAAPDATLDSPADWQVLPLSARNPAALREAGARLADHLAAHPGLALADVAHTLQAGRQAFAWRCAAVATEPAMVQALLTSPAGVLAQPVAAAETPPEVVFLFPGSGTQHPQMGAALYATDAAFRADIDHCCELLRRRAGLDLRSLLFPDAAHEQTHEADARLARIENAQPALFSVEYAMARAWMRRGVQPALMLGHSLGEYVAACLAGVFTLDDALQVVVARGRLMQSLPAGAMTAVSMSEAELAPLLEDGCDIAAVNGERLCVLSGPLHCIEAVEQALRAQMQQVRRLHVAIASHSAMTEAICADLEAVIAAVPRHPPRIPFVSNVTGRRITDAQATSPAYWAQHLRGTVRFADGLDVLLDEPGRVVLEVGPGDTLAGLTRQHPKAAQAAGIWASQAHPQQRARNAQQMALALAGLWCAGVEIDWAACHAAPRRRVPLPTYAFQRQRYWVDAAGGDDASAARPAAASRGVADWFYVPTWKRSEPLPPAPAGVGCAVVYGEDGGVVDGLVAHLAASGRAVVRVGAAATPARLGTHRHVLRPAQREDHEALLRMVAEEIGPVTDVYHLWGLVSDEQDLGFHSLVAMAPALQGVQSLTVVATGLADVLGDDELSPAKATLFGACKVIGQEIPALACRLVDVDQPGEPALAARIVAERGAAEAHLLVALRGAQRWVRGFEPARRDTPVQRRVRDGGAYLVTGGLGGVGSVLARELVRQGAARLALLSRTALPEPGQWAAIAVDVSQPAALRRQVQALLELQGLGAEVVTVRADVAQPAELRRAVAEARERLGALHGVVHAAGVAGGGMVATKTREQAEAVFAPKLAGTLALLEAVRPDALDFVLLCSSLTAITGAFGQSDYCGANAALDAIAVQEMRRTGRFVVAVNWDTWREVGLAAGQRLPDGLGITPSQGAEVFERLLSGPMTPQVVVSTIDLATQMAQAATARMAQRLLPEAAPARARRPRPVLPVPYAAPADGLEADLADTWSDFLGITPIGAHDNLFELGGDSLMAIQLIARIRQAYGVEVHPAEFFKAPTVAALSLLIETALLDEIENGAEPTPAVA